MDFVGWVSGEWKDRLFHESSIYCLASESEGFPMGVLDAWAYGVPCVMTPVGGLPDIVTEGENGLLFPIGDDSALANQLSKMMSDDALRKRVVEETDKYVNGIFNIDNINMQLDDIYSRL